MKKPIVSITKKDLIRQTFRCGGNGGQNVNKVETGVRFIHEPSGARGESCTYRTQGQNEVEAFRRLANSYEMQRWLKLETSKKLGQVQRLSEEEIYNLVDERLKKDEKQGNIKVEYYQA